MTLQRLLEQAEALKAGNERDPEVARRLREAATVRYEADTGNPELVRAVKLAKAVDAPRARKNWRTEYNVMVAGDFPNHADGEFVLGRYRAGTCDLYMVEGDQERLVNRMLGLSVEVIPEVKNLALNPQIYTSFQDRGKYRAKMGRTRALERELSVGMHAPLRGVVPYTFVKEAIDPEVDLAYTFGGAKAGGFNTSQVKLNFSSPENLRANIEAATEAIGSEIAFYISDPRKVGSAYK
tara:strand:- start:143 stop:856 length:714 start_codon:yes stop_codon:yes gene_type:complete